MNLIPMKLNLTFKFGFIALICDLLLPSQITYYFDFFRYIYFVVYIFKCRECIVYTITITVFVYLCCCFCVRIAYQHFRSERKVMLAACW
jgi:hypothetical protein